MRSENDPIEARKKKFLLVLPILIVPFLTMGFYAVGGGTPADSNANTTKNSGLQTHLPSGNTEEKQMDKMSYYNAAKADSLKKADQIKNDPYYQPVAGNLPAYPSGGDQTYGPTSGGNNNVFNPSVPGYTNTSEAKVYQRLNTLNDVLNQPAAAPVNPYATPPFGTQPSVNGADIDRLENMMKVMQNGNEQGDPEMQQISGLLEKILDIQHPGRMQEKIKDADNLNRGKVFAVSSKTKTDPISLLKAPGSQRVKSSSGFFSLDETAPEENFNTIAAVVSENQTLVSGSIVKLRLADEISINGTLIPKDTYVFGEAGISGERLNIKISNIRYKNSLYPVELNVYDLDGLDGIHIPGAISRDVAKQSSSSAIEGIGLPNIDAGIGAQAASAGIELSKSFIGKKIKLVKVTVKAGYQILLKDAKQTENN